MIDVLVPVLGRGHQIPPLIESVRAHSTFPVTITFICSPHDASGKKAAEETGEKTLVVGWRPSRADWARKLNHAYRLTEQPWILLGATDIRFHPGWDVVALEAAVNTGKRVIGTNDLGNPESMRNGTFSTHPLLARSYADELGTVDGPSAILIEVYDHNYVDREFAETAAWRNEWLYCRNSVVEHLHPHWGKGVDDATYKRGTRSFGRDRMLYLSRRPLWGQPGRPARRSGGRARV